jgi:hypothetical protein
MPTTRIPVLKDEPRYVRDTVTIYRTDTVFVARNDTLEFPWPPPQWSARYKLPTAIVDPDNPEMLGAIADRIGEAFTRGRIEEFALYTVGDSGFAYVSRLERIDRDGTPLPDPDRWPSEMTGELKARSIVAYFKSLFVASPGYYRVIAIVVSPRPIAAASEPMTPQLAGALANGPQVLPRRFRERRIAGAYGTALIYEFEAKKAQERPRLILSEVPPVQHLILAGLWRSGDLRR